MAATAVAVSSQSVAVDGAAAKKPISSQAWRLERPRVIAKALSSKAARRFAADALCADRDAHCAAPHFNASERTCGAPCAHEFIQGHVIRHRACASLATLAGRCAQSCRPGSWQSPQPLPRSIRRPGAPMVSWAIARCQGGRAEAQCRCSGTHCVSLRRAISRCRGIGLAPRYRWAGASAGQGWARDLGRGFQPIDKDRDLASPSIGAYDRPQTRETRHRFGRQA